MASMPSTPSPAAMSSPSPSPSAMSPSPAAPVGLVNFTGNWLMDVENSDSLAPLLAYHGFTVPDASAASSTSSSSTTMITTRVSSTGEMKQTTSTTTMGMGGIHAASVTPSLMGESLLAASTLGSSSGMGGSSLANGTSTSSLPAVQEGEGGSQETSRRGSVHDTDAHNDAAAAAAGMSGSPDGGASSSSSAASTAMPVESVPALIIQHSTRRLTTYLHALIPRYNDEGKLVRYDPVHSHSKLSIHEEYRLDSNYHSINTARGRVAARAYFAPHGQSLVVDTRCASKYDLERTERFLEDDGKRLVIEVRILSCAPDVQHSDKARDTTGVASKFAQADGGSSTPVHTVPSQPQQPSMVVKELLFLRRVFKRIVDANPDGPKSNQGTPAAASSSAGVSGVNLPAFGSGSGSAPPTPMKVETLLDFDEAATAAPRTRTRAETGAGAIAAENAAASKASLLRMQLSPAALAILPEQLTRATKVGSAGSGSDGAAPSTCAPSAWSQLSDLLYPRHFLLKRYQLTDLLFEGPPGSNSSASAAAAAQMPATLTAAIAAEHSAHASARRWMRLVDLVLLALLTTYILLQLGVFSREELAHELSMLGHAVEDGVMAGAHLVEGQMKEHMPGLHAAAANAVHSAEAIASQVANTITHAPAAAAANVAAAVADPLHSEL